MWLDAQWMQAGGEALKATLNVDAHMRKQMIEFLFDEGFWDRERLSWDGAVARWNACLNAHKNEFFKIAEVWALMKRFGRDDLFLAMAEDLGFKVQKVPTEERRMALLERIADAAERAAQVAETANGELVRLDTEPRRRPMRGDDGPHRFCLHSGGF